MFEGLENPEYMSREAMFFNAHQNGLDLSVFQQDKGLAGMFTPTSTMTDPISG